MNDFRFPRDRLQSSGDLRFIPLTVNIVKVVVNNMHIGAHKVTVQETSEASCYLCTSRDTLVGHMGKHIIVISLALRVTSPAWSYPILLYTWPAVMTDVPTRLCLRLRVHTQELILTE